MAVAGRSHVDGLVYLGYPLHPPGRPDKPRVDICRPSRPQLFVEGTNDPFDAADVAAKRRSRRVRMPGSRGSRAAGTPSGEGETPPDASARALRRSSAFHDVATRRTGAGARVVSAVAGRSTPRRRRPCAGCPADRLTRPSSGHQDRPPMRTPMPRSSARNRQVVDLEVQAGLDREHHAGAGHTVVVSHGVACAQSCTSMPRWCEGAVHHVAAVLAAVVGVRRLTSAVTGARPAPAVRSR
ncbi:alpha/beta family hydrolase [Microbacterium sp.]|uniref:alpha/beta family hydrolase n=1 Tax=Microbacterium sp. TaxID=51671 RepID=UPI003A8EC02F